MLVMQLQLLEQLRTSALRSKLPTCSIPRTCQSSPKPIPLNTLADNAPFKYSHSFFYFRMA